MRMTEIDNRDDLIDIREVIDILDGLDDDHCNDEPWTDEDKAYRDSLRELLNAAVFASEYEGHARDGMTLVRETHWVDYIKEWYVDTYGGNLGECDRDGNWQALSWDDIMSRMPFSCIDWKHVAEEVRSEHTSLEWGNVTYYVS